MLVLAADVVVAVVVAVVAVVVVVAAAVIAVVVAATILAEAMGTEITTVLVAGVVAVVDVAEEKAVVKDQGQIMALKLVTVVPLRENDHSKMLRKRGKNQLLLLKRTFIVYLKVKEQKELKVMMKVTKVIKMTNQCT